MGSVRDKAARATSDGLLAVDVAQNAVNVASGTNDIIQNGLTLENGLKVAGGTLGSIGAIKGIDEAAKTGCFVADTPVAVGWNYEPIYVAQESPPDAATGASPEDVGPISLGW